MKVDFKFVPSIINLQKIISNKSIFFMHIPKCGGTTIDHIFAKLSKILKTFDYKRYKYNSLQGKIKLNHSNINLKKQNFISGHVDFNFVEKIKNLYKCTIIREPTNRVVSHYKFTLHRLKKKPDEYTFKTFIENEINNNRDNLVTRHFCSLLDENVNITYKEKKLALTNLKYFDNIGIIENWDNFLINLLTAFELPSVLYSKFQEHKYNFSYNLTENDLDLIHKNFEQDYKIYDEVLNSNKKMNFKKNSNYNKNICIVSPYIKTEDRLYNETEVKKLLNNLK